MRRASRPRAILAPIVAAALAAIVPLATPGCGSDDGRVARYPASGQVLIGDKPAEGVLVRFYNAANPGDVDAPQPYATTDADGIFAMSTYQDGDGAPAGDYLVVLLWPEGPPGPGAPRDRLGNAFTDFSKTPYKATVAEGGSSLEPFRIEPDKVKKGTPRPSGFPEDPTLPRPG